MEILGIDMHAERHRKEGDLSGRELLRQREAIITIDRSMRALTVAEEQEDLLSTRCALEGSDRLFQAGLEIGVAGGEGLLQQALGLLEAILTFLVTRREEAIADVLGDLGRADRPDGDAIVQTDTKGHLLDHLHRGEPAFARLVGGKRHHDQIVASLDLARRQRRLQGDREDLFVGGGAIREEVPGGERRFLADLGRGAAVAATVRRRPAVAGWAGSFARRQVDLPQNRTIPRKLPGADKGWSWFRFP